MNAAPPRSQRSCSLRRPVDPHLPEFGGGADLYAERFVGFGTGDTRRRCGVGAMASPDINGARRGSGSARIVRYASACGIGRGANPILDFVGAFANDNTRQQNQQRRKDSQRLFQMVLLQGCAGLVPVDNVDEFPGIPYELEL